MTNFPDVNDYEVRFTGKRRGRGAAKNAWVETFGAAMKLAKESGGGLVYCNGSLVGNFSDAPTTGYADYVVGLRAPRGGK